MKIPAGMRREYTRETLHKSDLEADPLAQFQKWFDQISSMGVAEANAFTLSTINDGGFPTARVVLLKGVEEGEADLLHQLQQQKGQ